MARNIHLPTLLGRKIYKTGQTRGADDDDIYQNRVGRNSTVLIPYDSWETASHPPEGEHAFEHGFIVLISPRTYFSRESVDSLLNQQGLKLGVNLLVFYETREDWITFNPDACGWQVASSRVSPLGGEYVARVPAIKATAEGSAIKLGFTSTMSKGAGIRIYEYANSNTIANCRLQLEALFWLCNDAENIAAKYGVNTSDIAARKKQNNLRCNQLGLLVMNKLAERRLISTNGITMCPLCLEEVSAEGFFAKVEQAEGRLVHDLTITKLNLFHIEELRIGRYGHQPYNLGWGHHHCNVVVKDSGIDETLMWMTDVVDKNIYAGYIVPKSTGSS